MTAPAKDALEEILKDLNKSIDTYTICDQNNSKCTENNKYNIASLASFERQNQIHDPPSMRNEVDSVAKNMPYDNIYNQKSCDFENTDKNKYSNKNFNRSKKFYLNQKKVDDGLLSDNHGSLSWAGLSFGIISGLAAGWVLIVSVATAFPPEPEMQVQRDVDKFQFASAKHKADFEPNTLSSTNVNVSKVDDISPLEDNVIISSETNSNTYSKKNAIDFLVKLPNYNDESSISSPLVTGSIKQHISGGEKSSLAVQQYAENPERKTKDSSEHSKQSLNAAVKSPYHRTAQKNHPPANVRKVQLDKKNTSNSSSLSILSEVHPEPSIIDGGVEKMAAQVSRPEITPEAKKQKSELKLANHTHSTRSSNNNNIPPLPSRGIRMASLHAAGPTKKKSSKSLGFAKTRKTRISRTTTTRRWSKKNAKKNLSALGMKKGSRSQLSINKRKPRSFSNSRSLPRKINWVNRAFKRSN